MPATPCIDVSIPACPKLGTSFRSEWPSGMLSSSSFTAVLYKQRRAVGDKTGGERNDCYSLDRESILILSVLNKRVKLGARIELGM